MFFLMLLYFNEGTLITFKASYRSDDRNDVLLTTHKRNVSKEQNFTCTLIPCRILCNSDFLDLGK